MPREWSPAPWLLVKSGYLQRIIVQQGWEKRKWRLAIQAGMYWKVGVGGGGECTFNFSHSTHLCHLTFTNKMLHLLYEGSNLMQWLQTQGPESKHMDQVQVLLLVPVTETCWTSVTLYLLRITTLTSQVVVGIKARNVRPPVHSGQKEHT